MDMNLPMENAGVRVFARLSPYSFGLSLHIVNVTDRTGCRGVIMEKIETGMEMPTALVLNREQAQGLMDSLWESGIRPTEGMGSAGSFAAQAAHLSDMRSIAFASLEKAGVKCPSK
jgi:hypothetical protein